ncbi:MAG: class I SAM-dependent methyltransferase [Candidatus Magasanikbacteria bacterium]|jgi:2-polyprenyl-3-methyl-5-hydroxy-6-metoxy-1,4-benzoquinol methylase|nr:class I SAM-dependent methyltransferase [Candidatus Magasanikbacteria bacterium]MBT4071545.1 class I SAM-dependent methyltransferase [Candidatus Magasanikbacteria bacterium]
MRYFDSNYQRLVYIEQKADPKYWDKLWDVKNFKKIVSSIRKISFVYSNTTKYLSKGAKILEGGCGKGQYVYALDNWGYDTYGIDYAKNTIEHINKHFPELQVICGDVRKLPYKKDFFDGYWSFGVIEHFYNGYDDILKEMKRVIKSNGFLFITFPHMSLLRKIKSKLGGYPLFDTQMGDDNFYQFALDYKRVVKDLEMYGFSLKKKKYLDGVKGLKDEILIGKKYLQKLYDARSFVLKVFKHSLGICLAPVTSHSILLVMELKDK